MLTANRINSIIIFLVLASSIAFAHGEQMLYPMSGDAILLIAIIFLQFRYRVTWKYRLTVFLGGILTIPVSWLVVSVFFPRYYYTLLDNAILMTLLYYCILAAIFLPILRMANKLPLGPEKYSPSYDVELRCTQCGKMYPSQYWFNSPGICLDCGKVLSGQPNDSSTSGAA